MIAVVILMIILTILMLATSVVSVFVAYKSLTAFLAISEQHEEYRRYLNLILSEIEDSSVVVRTELIKRTSINLPETREFNSQLHHLENKIQSLKLALKEFLAEE